MLSADSASGLLVPRARIGDRLHGQWEIHQFPVELGICMAGSERRAVRLLQPAERTLALGYPGNLTLSNDRSERYADDVSSASILLSVSDADVIERPGIRPSDPELEEGKVAHIIRKDDQMRGYVLGEEITALCGEKFIPTRDPYQYPVCEGCRAALTLMNGGS